MILDGFNEGHKVNPVRIVGGGGVTDWGEEIPEETQELPRALFSPGPSSEDNLLGQEINHRGTLRWPHRSVELEPEDVVKIGDRRWHVKGYPNIWPLGTTAVVERFK